MDLASLVIYGSIVVVLYLVITTIRSIIFPPKPVIVKYKPRMIGEITADELSKYDGRDPFRPILFAVKGSIYDVTEARSFYGPGRLILICILNILHCPLFNNFSLFVKTSTLILHPSLQTQAALTRSSLAKK